MQVGSTKEAVSEINVTPLVDVVLVLLIIFMVITPVLLQETLIHLPKMEVNDAPPNPNEPGTIVIKINPDGSLALRVGEAEELVNQQQLIEKTQIQLDSRDDKSVFVDASTQVAYGQVVLIFDSIKGIKSGTKNPTIAIVETDDNPDDEIAPAGTPQSTAPPPAPAK